MHKSSFTTFSAIVSLGFVIAACSASNDQKADFGKGNGGGAGTDNPAGAGGGGDAGSAGDPGVGGDDSGFIDPGSDDGGTQGNCSTAGTDKNVDYDKDGYTMADGDCNECDKNTNPGAFDIPGNTIDEDCNGTPDDEPVGCDSAIKIDDADAFAGARAVGLCRKVDANATGKAKTWGVISAAYVKADGKTGMNAKSHGVVPDFGAAKVQDGKSMLVLSSGTARAPNQAGYQNPSGANMATTSVTPTGYPKDSAHCPGVTTSKTKVANDPAALQVKIRVPTNGNSFSFNLNFYTYEFPQYVCTEYNDFYVTLMDPKVATLPDGNISFDQNQSPISVNNSLLQVCSPQTAGGNKFTCPLGTGLLANTGFTSGGATGWLKTQAPVTPGSEITLLFAIWDAGDHVLDSTVLIDNFQWSVEAGVGITTTPVDNPK